MLTFNIWHLFASSLSEECDFIGDRIKHFDKIGKKKDDLHFVIGQVTTTTDALSSLDMRAT